jgi:hypothetical protein
MGDFLSIVQADAPLRPNFGPQWVFLTRANVPEKNNPKINSLISKRVKAERQPEPFETKRDLRVGVLRMHQK